MNNYKLMCTCSKEIKCLPVDKINESIKGIIDIQKEEIMKKNEELAEKLYDINRYISLYWIGMKKKPTEKEIMDLNFNLGNIIKDLRRYKYDQEPVIRSRIFFKENLNEPEPVVRNR